MEENTGKVINQYYRSPLIFGRIELDLNTRQVFYDKEERKLTATEFDILCFLASYPGAIIATNSTVVKSVEPYSIYGGNPAKFIKKRFSDEKIEFLLKLQWWNWSEEEIFDNLGMLTSEAGLEQLMNKKR